MYTMYSHVYLDFQAVKSPLAATPRSLFVSRRVSQAARAYTVKTIEFSPDGTKLAVAQSDNIVSDGLRIWGLGICQELMRCTRW